MIDRLRRSIEQSWYKRNAFCLLLLLPFSLLTFCYALLARRLRLDKTRYAKSGLLPVIVVGNVTVGGTGKTPLLLALATDLLARGFRVGVLSRGYGGEVEQGPLLITAETPVTVSGDEPMLLKQRIDVPVVVGSDRLAGLRYLSDNKLCDVVLSDDGLQHFQLPRQMEIMVVDGQRVFGNGFCLPAGPLREPLGVVQQVDFRVINGSLDTSRPSANRLQSASCFEMQLAAGEWVHLQSGERLNHQALLQRTAGQSVFALAGIGYPPRFFSSLAEAGFVSQNLAFADHHVFSADDFSAIPESAFKLMTEKDAVKCHGLGLENAWYLEVNAQLPDSFWQQFYQRLDVPGIRPAGKGEKND